MFLVDTSVWVDYFRGKDTPEVDRLVSELSDGADVCLCGLILTEVLQGIASDREHEQVRSLFEQLVYLPLSRAEHVLAAEIYRKARRRGKTIRNTLDCVIAACAIAYDVPLLTTDRDFLAIREVSQLELVICPQGRGP